MIWRRKRLHRFRQKSIELVAVAALFRMEELVLVGDVLRRKSILGTIDYLRGGNGLGNNWMMLCRELLGWIFLLVSLGGSNGEGHMS